MKKPRRTLKSVYEEIYKSRIADFLAWRLALARCWRIDLVWTAIKFRMINSRRRRVLIRLAEARMSPDWRESRPKKLQRKLGILPPV
jgi:hypothetical protein